MQQQELVILHVILGTILMEQHVNHVQERQTVRRVHRQKTNVQHVNLGIIQVELVVFLVHHKDVLILAIHLMDNVQPV